MSWRVRHEGSSRSATLDSVEEVHQGLADGVWTPEDEVQAPGETTWTPLSSHPATEDAAAEVEPPEPSHHEDETHLDMTALIDVCLVLLIFFMMLIGYMAMQKRLAADRAGAQAGPQPTPVQQVRDSMIWLKITMKDGQPVYVAEVTEGGKQVVETLDANDLTGGLKKFIKPGRTAVLLDAAKDVPHGDLIRAQDAATGLELKINLLMVEKR